MCVWMCQEVFDDVFKCVCVCVCVCACACRYQFGWVYVSAQIVCMSLSVLYVFWAVRECKCVGVSHATWQAPFFSTKV